MKEKSCGTVIENSGAYLLLHYASGHWDFPKGHVEGKETEEETARRELLEETGISNVALVEGFKERVSYYYSFRGKNRFKEVIYLLMKTSEKEVRLSDEHIGFQWLPYDEAMKQLTFENAKKVLEKAHILMGNQSRSISP